MLRLSAMRNGLLHFITTANVVIAVVAAGSCCLAWLLDISIPTGVEATTSNSTVPVAAGQSLHKTS